MNKEVVFQKNSSFEVRQGPCHEQHIQVVFEVEDLPQQVINRLDSIGFSYSGEVPKLHFLNTGRVFNEAIGRKEDVDRAPEQLSIMNSVFSEIEALLGGGADLEIVVMVNEIAEALPGHKVKRDESVIVISGEYIEYLHIRIKKIQGYWVTREGWEISISRVEDLHKLCSILYPRWLKRQNKKEAQQVTAHTEAEKKAPVRKLAPLTQPVEAKDPVKPTASKGELEEKAKAEVLSGVYGPFVVSVIGSSFFCISFAYSRERVAEIKRVQGATFNPSMKEWWVPRENWESLKRMLSVHAYQKYSSTINVSSCPQRALPGMIIERNGESHKVVHLEEVYLGSEAMSFGGTPEGLVITAYLQKTP